MDATMRDAAGRFAALLRSPVDPAVAVPGLEWTVGETAAHVLGEFVDYTAYAMGERDPDVPLDRTHGETPSDRAAAANAAQLERFPERDPKRLADSIEAAAEAWLAAASQRSAGERVRVNNGVAMTSATMSAALLGEFVVHGWDIAHAAGRPWPIGRVEALRVVDGVLTLLPEYLDRKRAAGLHVRYELRLRGGPRYLLTVEDGEAVVGAAGPRADCRITADPVAFLLVGFGRVGQWGQIARGRLVASGRRPWLATAFTGLITGP